MQNFLILIVLITLLYFFTFRVTTLLFTIIFRLIKNKKAALYITSIIYFPGTVIHEFAHFFAAAGLFLRVDSITLFPEIDEDHVRLGSVRYVRADPLRGFLVGIAPFFAGTFVLYLIIHSGVLLEGSLLLRGLAFYLLFAISSSMFSSKKDLADLIFVIPVILVVTGAIYIFNINLLGILANTPLPALAVAFVEKMNYYLGISVIANAILMTLLFILVSIL